MSKRLWSNTLLAIFIVCLVSVAILSFMAGYIELGAVFVTLGISVGVGEIVSKIRYDHTMSQRFGDDHPKMAAAIVILMVVGVLALVLHLVGVPWAK